MAVEIALGRNIIGERPSLIGSVAGRITEHSRPAESASGKRKSDLDMRRMILFERFTEEIAAASPGTLKNIVVRYKLMAQCLRPPLESRVPAAGQKIDRVIKKAMVKWPTMLDVFVSNGPIQPIPFDLSQYPSLPDTDYALGKKLTRRGFTTKIKRMEKLLFKQIIRKPRGPKLLGESTIELGIVEIRRREKALEAIANGPRRRARVLRAWDRTKQEALTRTPPSTVETLREVLEGTNLVFVSEDLTRALVEIDRNARFKDVPTEPTPLSTKQIIKKTFTATKHYVGDRIGYLLLSLGLK
jgi:hypothetical protein